MFEKVLAGKMYKANKENIYCNNYFVSDCLFIKYKKSFKKR